MKIIMYVVDSLRYDHLGCYGYERNTSPFIDDFAKDSVIYDNAYATATWTRPNLASILSGRLPTGHGVITMESSFVESFPCLPDFLKTKDFRTAAFSTIGQFSRVFGFDRGFDVFLELFRKVDCNKSLNVNWNPICPSDILNQQALPWIVENRNSDFFAIFWASDTHVPYKVDLREETYSCGKNWEEKYLSGHLFENKLSSQDEQTLLIDLYDTCIRRNDANLGKLFEQLKSLGIYEECMILVLADHGELFNEHSDQRSRIGNLSKNFRERMFGKREFYGRKGHLGVVPYEEVIHIPFIVKMPNQEHAGKRVRSLASLTDIFPTVARIISQNQISGGTDGLDLFQNDLTNEKMSQRYIYTYTKSEIGSNAYYSIQDENWKYVCVEPPSLNTLWSACNSGTNALWNFARYRYVLATELLFHLGVHNEEINQINEKPDLSDKFRNELMQWKSKVISFDDEGTVDLSLDRVLQDQLKSLGYL